LHKKEPEQDSLRLKMRALGALPSSQNSPRRSCGRPCRNRRSANYHRRRRCLKITHSFGFGASDPRRLHSDPSRDRHITKFPR